MWYSSMCWRRGESVVEYKAGRALLHSPHQVYSKVYSLT